MAGKILIQSFRLVFSECLHTESGTVTKDSAGINTVSQMPSLNS